VKLVRYGQAGHERPGIIDEDGSIWDVHSLVEDVSPDSLAPPVLQRLREVDRQQLTRVEGEVRLGPPVSGCRNFYAVGMNYGAHAAEVGTGESSEPMIFNKATSCISGPNDPIVLPDKPSTSDWEVELGFVIGTAALNLAAGEGLLHIAGYLIVNDISERDFQANHGGQWVKGKSLPTFGPLGPWLVTSDEVPDPQDLALELKVNGEVMQSASTSEMIVGCGELVEYLSGFMQLLPGDIVTTGTPAGIGAMQNPPRYLAAGDVMEASVAGLGLQRYTVVANGV
jgi:2,4-diketo-3-deoxy-L-fuconate hydrolase